MTLQSAPHKRLSGQPPPAHLARNSRFQGWLIVGEIALAFAIASLTFVVHNVSFMLSHPFWLDEAWVADATRVPWRLVAGLTGPSPLGWTVLLRLIPGDGAQRFRLITLIFAALAVLAAYALGRELRLMPVVAGTVVAVGVLLSPVMLVNDELKQYSAEAFVSVLLLYFVARVETVWSRSRLSLLCIVAGLALLVTNSAVFVGVAAVASLGIVALAQRRWRRLAEVAIAGAGMLVIQGLIYVTIDKPHQITSLSSYWNGYYVPRHGGLSGVVSFVRHTGAAVTPYFGFRVFAITVVLALGGLATLVWLRRVALALTTPLTIGAVMVASAFRKYPFLDLRTSTFWMVMVVVLMGIGAAGALRAVGSRSLIAAGLVAAVAFGGWYHVTDPYLRVRSLPNEDVRAQIAYFDTHYRSGDILVLGYTASWGFAFYQHGLTPVYRHVDYAGTGFVPEYPNVDWIVEMLNRNPSDVVAAWNSARAKASLHPGARIWIIRTHQATPEAAEWNAVLRGQPATVLPVGPEPLVVVDASKQVPTNP
jgi:hypothetical protein